MPPASPSLPYNVDKKLIYIAPSLCVAGFGGSLPAYLRNGKKFWNSKLRMISNISLYTYLHRLSVQDNRRI